MLISLRLKMNSQDNKNYMRITYSLLRSILSICVLFVAQNAATQTNFSPAPITSSPISSILNPPPASCKAPINPITGNPTCTGAQAGNPLNVMTGNKFQREVDMAALPGVLGLELVRYYNSGASLESSGKPIGGRGWRLSYDAEIYIQPGTQAITLTQADGTVTNFSPSFNKTTQQTQWRSSSSDAGVISIQAGIITSQANPANIKEPKEPKEFQYKLTLPNKTTQTFQTYANYNQGNSGKLIQIKAATGETVTIQRNNAGFPERITDPQGRSLVFNYLDPEQKKAADRYRGIQSIDTPVGRYEYSYGSDKQNAPMTLLANLASVKLPATKGSDTKDSFTTRLYHYEDTRFPTLLTGISIADAQTKPKRLVTWGYDHLGRANLSVKGEPARLELGSDGKPLEPKRLAAGTGIEQVTLEFSVKTAQTSKTNNTQEGSSGYTILTNSLGQTTRYDYKTIAGQQHITQVRGAGCVTCGASNIRYSYDNLGRRTGQTQLDNNGQAVSGTQTDFDAQGRVSRISSIQYTNGKASPAKLQTRYEYTGDETVATLVATPSVISSVNKDKEYLIRYSRNQQGQITQVTETGYSPTQEKLDDTSKPEELKRTLTRSTTYTYQTINGKSVLMAIADPLGNVTKYQWDAAANTITQVNYPMGLTASMTYDATTGRMVQTTGIDGQSTQVSYTAQGDIASWSKAGRTITTEQDMLGRTVLWKSNDGQSIRASYDELDHNRQRQIRYTLPDGQSLVSSLSSESQTLSVGWQGNDEQSIQRTIVNAKQTAYSPSTGLPVEIIAPSGLKTTLGYDQANNLTSIQRGRQTISKTTEGFDPLNQLTKLDVSGAKYTLGSKTPDNALTLPTAATYTSTVDDFGRTVIMQNPEKGRSTATYDLNDKLIQLKDSLRTSTASFDALGRLVQRRHSINKDASGTTISTATVTVTSDPKENKPKDEVFTYTYEGARLKSISGASQTTTYSYTKEGQVAQEQVTLQNTLQNNATTTSFATSFTTNHTYDTFGRLSQTQLPEGATLSHHYSAKESSNPGRLERVDYQPAAQAGWHGWWTQLARLAVPDYGTQALVNNIQTDSAHGLLGYQSSNGQTVQATFDSAGRLKSWRDGPVSTTLGFNQNDELAALDKSVPPLANLGYSSQPAFISSQQTLQYNIMGQLSDVKTSQTGKNEAGNAATQALESYSYDQNGNRLQSNQQAGQNSYQYKPASDQLQSIQLGAAKSNYTYNSHGEPVQISTAEGDKTQTRDLSYGARGELLAIADQGKPTASYQYNHALQRVSKTVSNQTTNYLWHGGMIDAEIQNGQVTKRYIFINLRPVAVIEYENDTNSDQNSHKNHSASGSKYAGYKPKSTAIYAIHTDHLGTPQAITDSQQAVVWRADYATFGKATVQARVVEGATKTASGGIISTANAATNAAKPFEFNLRFAGQYEDVESGYHYNWHRYYDPNTGRYLTPDPIGLAGGLNGYGYAGQDPLRSIDPYGLFNYLLAPSETYADRAAAYRQMQQDLEQAGVDVKWFGAAAELNDAFADTQSRFGFVPGGDWMNDLGKQLYNKNLSTYYELMKPYPPGTCRPGGKSLDYALVSREQNAVQDYINSTPPTATQRLLINGGFTTLARAGMPAYLRTSLYNVEAITGHDYSFWNVQDRIELGNQFMNRKRGEW